ncbi:MAG TPA: hypothetical protein DEF51_22760 [Myxococcales bacterium]|nr:hypothetical protein [Myxococcales bacterium]
MPFAQHRAVRAHAQPLHDGVRFHARDADVVCAEVLQDAQAEGGEDVVEVDRALREQADLVDGVDQLELRLRGGRARVRRGQAAQGNPRTSGTTARWIC